MSANVLHHPPEVGGFKLLEEKLSIMPGVVSLKYFSDESSLCNCSGLSCLYAILQIWRPLSQSGCSRMGSLLKNR